MIYERDRQNAKDHHAKLCPKVRGHCMTAHYAVGIVGGLQVDYAVYYSTILRLKARHAVEV
jgi:hypothetical protein